MAAVEPKRTLALLFALVAAGWLWRTRRGARSRVPNARIAAGGFLVLSAATAVWGPPAGALELGVAVGSLGFFLAADRLGRTGAIRATRVAAILLGGCASLVALVALAQGARGFSLHGLQGNPNWLGLLLAACLPLNVDAAIALARNGRRSLAALVATAILLEVAALVLSHSRVAWCASVVALLVGIPAFLRAIKGRAAAIGGGAVAAIVVAAIVVSAWRTTLSHDAPARVSLEGRLSIARVSLLASRDAFPLGAGLGGFGRAFLDAQGSVLAALEPSEAARRFTNATTAHDEPLQIAVESGPVAALFFVAFIVLSVRSQVRGRWPAGAAAFAAIGVCSLGDSPLRQPAIAVLLGVLAAAIPAYRSAQRRPRWSRRPLPRKAALIAFAALASWLLSISVRSWLSSRLRAQATHAEPANRSALLAKSVARFPDSGESLLELGLAELALGDPERAISHLETSRRLLANVGTDAAIGQAALALGDADRGRRAYAAALRRNPGSARARVGLAEALRRLGRLEEAEREAAIAHRLLPGDARTRALLERIQEDAMDLAPDIRE